jgi:hypothetical protein
MRRAPRRERHEYPVNQPAGHNAPLVLRFGEGCLLHALGRGRLSDSPPDVHLQSRAERRPARLFQTARHCKWTSGDQRV